jgi:predicted transcriptional regulator YdeE
MKLAIIDHDGNIIKTYSNTATVPKMDSYFKKAQNLFETERMRTEIEAYNVHKNQSEIERLIALGFVYNTTAKTFASYIIAKEKKRLFLEKLKIPIKRFFVKTFITVTKIVGFKIKDNL